jgi:hypothetical protein
MAKAITYRGKIFTDPERKLYEALDFSRSLGKVFTLNAAMKAMKALAGGYRPGSLQGDALQLGGAVAIGEGPSLLYYQACEDSAEMIDLDQLLQQAGK